MTRKETTKMLIITGLLFVLIASTLIIAAETKPVKADTASPSESSTNSIPAYAFNGAYVTYTLNDYIDRKVTFTISDVNLASQTFKVSWSFIGSWDFKSSGSSEVISYANISPLPSNTSKSPFSAASFADLQTLNKGETPENLPVGVVVKTNVSIFAFGGYYFNTDELNMAGDSNGSNGFSVFVDMRSGLTVAEDFGEDGIAWGIAYGQLSLINTNIPMTANVSPSSSPAPSGPDSFNLVTTVAVAGVLSAVVVGAGFLVYFKKRNRQAKNKI